MKVAVQPKSQASSLSGSCRAKERLKRGTKIACLSLAAFKVWNSAIGLIARQKSRDQVVVKACTHYNGELKQTVSREV